MKLRIGLAIICTLALSSALFAQTRTTPVEVENSPTVKVDSTANNVKAEQFGPWMMTITGTPNVSVTNIPTVSINPASNVVSTPTVSKGVKILSSVPSPNRVIPVSYDLSSLSFDTTGYREVRVVVKFSTLANLSQFKIFIEYELTPGGSTFTPGYVTGQLPTEPIIKNATFVQSSGTCVFTAPVLSSRMYLLFVNESTTNTVTIDAERSWVYLVN